MIRIEYTYHNPDLAVETADQGLAVITELVAQLEPVLHNDECHWIKQGLLENMTTAEVLTYGKKRKKVFYKVTYWSKDMSTANQLLEKIKNSEPSNKFGVVLKNNGWSITYEVKEYLAPDLPMSMVDLVKV